MHADGESLKLHSLFYLCVEMFKGELNHKTTCLNCKEGNNSRSCFWTLPLAVEDSCCQTYSVVLCFPLTKIRVMYFFQKYIRGGHAGWMLCLQEKGLKAFFKGEKVCGDNKMYCNRCNKKQDADFVSFCHSSFPFYSWHQNVNMISHKLYSDTTK